MDPSSRSEAILGVGKQLVRQLGLRDSVDTLGRWLAHALAEKLLAVEGAPAAEKPARQAEAIDLILKLWAHRRDFPRGTRPFEDPEGLAMALAQLDPNDKAPRFFSPASPREVVGAAPEAKPWLDRALAIDAAARAAIRYCLLAADEATPGDSTKWAELAEAAGFECDVEVLLVRFVGQLSEQQRKDLDSEVASSQRHVRARVASLKEAASAIEADLARKLRAGRRPKASDRA